MAGHLRDTPRALKDLMPAIRLPQRFLDFARRQSVLEIAQQYQMLRGFALRRRALVTVAFGLGLAYQSLPLTLLFFALHCVFDLVTLRLLRDLDPGQSPGRYLLALLASMGLSATFSAYPALSWLVDQPLARAYALSLILIALIHHATLRNIHRPLSMTASIATTTVAVVANTWAWAWSRIGRPWASPPWPSPRPPPMRC